MALYQWVIVGIKKTLILSGLCIFLGPMWVLTQKATANTRATAHTKATANTRATDATGHARVSGKNKKATNSPTIADTMITEWRIQDHDLTLELPLVEGYKYNFSINWGDGSRTQKVTRYNDKDSRHVYLQPGQYTITIKGLLTAWGFQKHKLQWRSGYAENRHEHKLIAVHQLGQMGWQSLRGAFANCRNLTEFNGPHLTGVHDISYAFFRARNLNPDVSGWDTSQVTDISYIFRSADNANPDVSQWDTSQVLNMSSAFRGADCIQPDVSQWNTSKVVDMSHLFREADCAQPDVRNWDTSQVVNMSYMFAETDLADPDVRNWDTSQVVNMSYMFFEAEKADPDVSDWDTSQVLTMVSLFQGAHRANPDVTRWDTSQVTDMSCLFFDTRRANPNVSLWNTTRVRDLSYMFFWARNANPNTMGWDFSSVRQLRSLFDEAGALSPHNYALFLKAATHPKTGLVDLNTVAQEKKSCRLGVSRSSAYCRDIGFIPASLNKDDFIDRGENYTPNQYHRYYKYHMARRQLIGRGWLIEDQQGIATAKKLHKTLPIVSLPQGRRP